MSYLRYLWLFGSSLQTHSNVNKRSPLRTTVCLFGSSLPPVKNKTSCLIYVMCGCLVRLYNSSNVNKT